MLDKLGENIISAVKKLYGIDHENVHFEHPNLQEFGDYSTNLALELAPKVKQSPMEIAKSIVYEIEKSPILFEIDNKRYQFVDYINVASPGFINLKISDIWLKSLLKNILQSADNYGSSKKFTNLNIILEYTDPNPFKVFHIGHLMTSCIGESLARIYEFLGANTKRANYQGDVGLHVAQSIWGMIYLFEQEKLNTNKLEKLPMSERIAFLGRCYVEGRRAFDEDLETAKDIKQINCMVYTVAQKFMAENKVIKEKFVNYDLMLDPNYNKYDFALIKSYYLLGRQWSLDYFETLYKKFGTRFDYYYFESVVSEIGYKIVKENLSTGIFLQDDGAVIFKGDDYGLHTRVFINNLGLPIYESKDLGLAFAKYEDFQYSKSIIITGNEINEYFRVVLKAMSMINKHLSDKTVHIGHGMMKFKDRKMSSRTGDVVAGEELLNIIKQKINEKMIISNKSLGANDKADTVEKIAVGSLKYMILKNGIGNDIIYDEEEAVNLHGNSGSYLMYTYSRINSVIERCKKDYRCEPIDYIYIKSGLNDNERDILRHIYKFPEEVEKSCERLSPNLIASFVHLLAQKYNKFYAEDSILECKDESQKVLRIYISMAVGQVIKNSLNLLGINVVSKM